MEIITEVLRWAGYVFGIIGTGYGIMMRRKLVRLQIKTEKAKASYYNSKKKTEEMRKAEHATVAVKNFLDWFRGKQDDRSNETL